MLEIIDNYLNFVNKSHFIIIFAIIILYSSFKFYHFWKVTESVTDLFGKGFNDQFLCANHYENSDEKQRYYPNTWYPIIQSKDLNRRQVKPIYVLNKELVVYRTESGKVHVLDAYCAHQGTHLGIGGNVVGEDISCPFHSWTFNGNGLCTSVPGLKSCSLPKAVIKSWKTIEINKWVYLWYHKEDCEPTWMPPIFNNLEKAHFSGRHDFGLKCHIMDVYGNLFDPEHLDKVHSMAGIISDDQVLRKDKFYQFMRTIFRNDYNVSYDFLKLDELDGKNWPELQITITPVLFNRKLEFLKITGSIKLCPPVVYFHLKLFNSRVNFYILIAMIPISSMRICLYNCNYHDKWNPLSRFISMIVAKNALKFVLPELILLNNKRFMNQPCSTHLDKMQNKFLRWFTKNFYCH